MSKNTGGSAFPIVYDFGREERGCEPGMTLRDYFVAHAPADPQHWFIPTMPTSRPVPVWVADVGGKEYASHLDAERACGDCFCNKNQQAIDEWDSEFGKQRFIQWPGAWADEMIKERQK